MTGDDETEAAHPRLSREQAFELAGDMELVMLQGRGLARAMELMSHGVADGRQSDAIGSQARALEAVFETANEMRERLWLGLNSSDGGEEPATPSGT